MLGLIEKLQYWISGLILFVILALFLVLGAPGSKYVSGARERSTTTVSLEEETPQGPTMKTAPVSEEDRATLRKVGELARKHRALARLSRVDLLRLEKKNLGVTRRDYDVLREPGNWLSELDKAGRIEHTDADGRTTMIELKDIEPNSYLEQFGFRDGDKILLIDGAVTEYDVSQAPKYYEQAEAAFKRLGSGGKFTITILRGGKPVNLEFELENLR